MSSGDNVKIEIEENGVRMSEMTNIELLTLKNALYEYAKQSNIGRKILKNFSLATDKLIKETCWKQIFYYTIVKGAQNEQVSKKRSKEDQRKDRPVFRQPL
jgi:hypothetical protein